MSQDAGHGFILAEKTGGRGGGGAGIAGTGSDLNQVHLSQSQLSYPAWLLYLLKTK
jgi:hypothetical protein